MRVKQKGKEDMHTNICVLIARAFSNSILFIWPPKTIPATAEVKILEHPHSQFFGFRETTSFSNISRESQNEIERPHSLNNNVIIVNQYVFLTYLL